MRQNGMSHIRFRGAERSKNSGHILSALKVVLIIYNRKQVRQEVTLMTSQAVDTIRKPGARIGASSVSTRLKRVLGLVGGTAALLALVLSTSAYAATITVGTLADATATGKCSLRDAITTANGTAVAGSGCASGGASNTIMFAKGLSGIIRLGSTLPDIESNLTIAGPGRGLIAISGQNAVPVMTIGLSNSVVYTVSLNNLTIENGNGGDFSGGLLVF